MRVGYITARDKKAASEWQRRSARKQPGLTGADLDKAVMMAGVRTGRSRYMDPRRSSGANIRTEHVN